MSTRIKYNQLKESPSKKPCRVATTDNITNLLTGAPNIVDGVSLSLNDRVLVKSQTTSSQNGVYDVVTVGTGSDGVWQRSTDLSIDDDVYDGISLFINSGTANGNSLWYLNTPDPITLDTTSLTFSQFQSGGADGNGIYDGSGTVSTSTIATTTDNISFLGPAVGSGGGFYVGTSSGSARLHVLDVDTQMQLSYDSSHYTTVHHDNVDLLLFKGVVTAEDSEVRFLSNSSASHKIRLGYLGSLNSSYNISSINIGGKTNFRLTYGSNNPVTDPIFDFESNGTAKLGMNTNVGANVGVGISASGTIGARLDVYSNNTTTGNILRLRNGNLSPVFSVRGDGNLYAYSTTVTEMQSGGVSDYTKGWLYLTDTESSLGFNVIGGLTKNGAYFSDGISSLQFDNRYVFKSEGSTTLVGGPSGSNVDPHIEFSHNLLSSTSSVDSSYIKVTDNLGSKGIIYDGDYTANFTTYSLVTKGYVDSVSGGGGVTGSGTTNYVTKWTGVDTLSSTSLLYDNNTFVGINTTTQNSSEKLRVTGGVRFDDGFGHFIAQNGSFTSQADVASNNFSIISNGGGISLASLKLIGATAGFGRIHYGKTGNTQKLDIYNELTSSAVITLSSSDNVGIGTASPSTKLHVFGGFRLEDGTESDGYVLTSDASGNATWQVGGGDTTTQTTGLTISFASKQIYNTPASPGTASITNDLTGSQLGIVQKIYHNSSATPSVPAGWVLLGDGIYFASQLNIIYAEWVTGTRVEYWIIQEQ